MRINTTIKTLLSGISVIGRFQIIEYPWHIERHSGVNSRLTFSPAMAGSVGNYAILDVSGAVPYVPYVL